MTIVQCKFCKKPFHSVGGSICPDCLDQIDKDFLTIRDYLYDHPGAFDIDAVCEATEVNKKIALHLLAEKRLNISLPGDVQSVPGGLSCSICHKPISYGNMCEDCKISLSNKLTSSPMAAAASSPKREPEKKKPIQPDSGAKIRIRGRD